MPTLAKKIRSLRMEREFSLSQLAQRSGVSKAYLSQLEAGTADNPSVEAARKLAKALDVSLYDLLGEEQPAAKSPKLPAGLKAFAASRAKAGESLTRKEIDMLQAIRYRGREPRTADDWAYLFETIKRVAR